MKRRQTELWDAGYVRVSIEMQVERDSLQNQIQALAAYAAAHGLRLRIYKDEGISAKDTDRPELQRLLGDVRSGCVRTVLVTKLDRISRSLADLLDLMRLFEQHEVKFISLRHNIDTSGPVGRLCSTSCARLPSSSGVPFFVSQVAIVAYEQPVTRADIRAIRRADCDGPWTRFVARKLVEEGRRSADATGT